MVATAKQRERLKALRKKHGLGEFRKAKSIKRGAPSRSMAKKRRSSRRSIGGASNLTNTAIGVTGYVLFETFVEPRFAGNVNPIMLNIAELAFGMWLSRKGGMLGNVGKAAVYINAYQLAQTFATGTSSKMINSSVSSTFPTY